MPDFYSLFLAAAIALVGGALGAAALFRIGALGWRWQGAVRKAALAGLALGLAAALVHLRMGHRPGSLAELGWNEFFAEHPALVAVAVAGLLAVWLSGWRRGP
jgi:Na+(H+)/acetate symporter ActP